MKCTIYVRAWNERPPEAVGTVELDEPRAEGRLLYTGAAEGFLRTLRIVDPGPPRKRLKPSDGERYLEAIPRACWNTDEIFVEVTPSESRHTAARQRACR